MKTLKYLILLVSAILCLGAYKVRRNVLWLLDIPFYTPPRGRIISNQRFLSLLQDKKPQCRNKGPYLVASRSPLEESSGLAMSRLYPNSRYEINDSFNDALVFRIRPDNSIASTIQIKEGGTDFESLDSGPCDNEHCIYLADTGNNFGLRDKLKLIRFREEVPEDQEFLDLIFDKAPDAEALVVHPISGEIYLFTKSIPSRIYKIAARIPWNQEWRPEYVGEAIFNGPSGAAFGPEGQQLFLLGRWGLGRIAWTKVQNGDSRDFIHLQHVQFHQPEGITVTREGHILYTSESSWFHMNYRNLAISPCL